MRVTFAETLAELAAADRRIVLLTGDLGFRALDAFIVRHPDRFYNVGVAEQNMVGLATGLAEAGFIPFVYSIIPFAVLRPYEVIRHGPVLHSLPVRIVGVGAGHDYGINGFTHHGLDDIAVTRIHPNLTVIAPADFQQARSALLATWDRPGPIYYRLGKDQETTVPDLDGRFVWDEPAVLRDGQDVLLLSTSSIASDVAQVAQELARSGISAAFAVVAQINPPPATALAEMMRRFRLVCTVENHLPSGGLGSLIAEVAADHAVNTRLLRIGATAGLDGRSGSMAFMHRLNGLAPEQIIEKVRVAWDEVA